MIGIGVREAVGKINLKRDYTCKHIPAYFLYNRKLCAISVVVKVFLPKIAERLLSAEATTSTSGDTQNSREFVHVPEFRHMSYRQFWVSPKHFSLDAAMWYHYFL